MFGAVFGPAGAEHNRRTLPETPGSSSVCPDQHQHPPQCHPCSADTRPVTRDSLKVFQTISFDQID